MPIRAPQPSTPARPTPKVVPGTANLYPGGGSPLWDSDYRKWLDEFVGRINRRYVDKHCRPGKALPDAELLTVFQLTNHLFKWIVGDRINTAIRHAQFEDATQGLRYTDRERFVSTQFHHRMIELVAEAEAYAVKEEAECDELGVPPWCGGLAPTEGNQ